MVKRLSKYERDMHSALDHELSESRWEALQAHLDESSGAADYWDRLRELDQFFHDTPMVAPSPGFYDRVMAAIAAMHLPDFADRQISVGVALGLAVAAILTLPVLSALLVLLLSVITDPGMWNILFQAVTTGASYVIGLVGDLGSGLETAVSDTPMVPALLSTVIPMTMLWMWLVWYLLGGRQSLANRQVA